MSAVHFAPSYVLLPTLKECCWVAGGDTIVHINCVLCMCCVCVCVLFVITCCVYPACLRGRVCCVTRSTLSTLEVDMALLSVSWLMCVWYMVSRVDYCVDIVFADSAHCVSVVVGLCMFLARVASSYSIE